MTSTRRDVLKKAVAGTAVAGVAWSAPRVEGLSLRPNYAAAASNTTTFSFSFFPIQESKVSRICGDATRVWAIKGGSGSVEGTIDGGTFSVVSCNTNTAGFAVTCPPASVPLNTATFEVNGPGTGGGIQGSITICCL